MCILCEYPFAPTSVYHGIVMCAKCREDHVKKAAGDPITALLLRECEEKEGQDVSTQIGMLKNRLGLAGRR